MLYSPAFFMLSTASQNLPQVCLCARARACVCVVLGKYIYVCLPC
jgi:hypothetical protein